MMRINYLFTLMIGLLFGSGLHSQEELAYVSNTANRVSTISDAKPLTVVLRELEDRYDIHILTQSSLVSDKIISHRIDHDQTADEALGALLDKTGLQFRKIGGTNYVLEQGEIREVKIPALVTEVLLSEKPEVLVTATGMVTDEEGEPLIGVNVQVKGAAKGTSTDFDGKFELTGLAEDAILVFSYIGYQTQEVAAGAGNLGTVVLFADAQTLDEVVVTALGIKRAERSLGYSVGKVDGKDMNETTQGNFLSVLSGKVSGVQISQMDGLPGASMNIVIRGTTSLNNDNQPLFVIDGVPVNNYLNNIYKGADMGNPISDINQSDIANISILKGASAAALYGSRAGNGVVLITTKSGAGRDKGLGVSYNTSYVWDQPYNYVDVQTKFASGKTGTHVLEEGQNENWGPMMDVGDKYVQWNSDGVAVPLVSYPNRFKDFFQTGTNFTNNVAIDGNYDKGNFRLSFGNVNSGGIVPNTDYNRTSFNLNSQYRVNDRFRVTANMGITGSGSGSRPNIDGGRDSPVRSLYEMGANINIMDLRDYWEPGLEGIQQRKYKYKQNNAWFLAYENTIGFTRDRVVSKFQLDYDLTPDLSIMARYTRDGYTQENESKKAFSTYGLFNGGYNLLSTNRKENNMDVILSFEKQLNDDFNFNALAGFNRLDQFTRRIQNNAEEMVIPQLYTISNGVPGTVTYQSQIYEKYLYGAYGMASLGYRDMIYLELTARNDWSSTLPSDNNSFFYPSASLSALVSEMLPMPNWVTLLKLRGGYAQVGNDVGPYQLAQYFSVAADWGENKRLYMGGTLRNANLKPEIATSTEVGFDLRLFNSRVGLEATAYRVQNENQILHIGLPVESGATSKLINAGLIESTGFEVGLNLTPIQTESFTWDMGFSLTRNRTKIVELAEGIEYFNFGEVQGAKFRTYIGGTLGDIFEEPLLTVKDQSSEYYGFPLLTGSGRYQSDSDPNNLVKIGNYNHDFVLGIQPTLSFKNFSLYANIEWRQGGEFYSESLMFMANNGQTEASLSGAPYDKNRGIEEQILENPDFYFGQWIGGRNAEYGGFEWPGNKPSGHDASFNAGVRQGTDAEGNVVYIENLGGPDTKWVNPYTAHRYDVREFPSRNIYDATYVKLRELSLTYSFEKNMISRLKLQGLSLSVVGNNVFQWVAAGIDIDPERAFKLSGSQWVQGYEYYNIAPWTRSLGFKLNIEF
ncbi:SusC/RagA family TonB-linked outer membrane protein [Membranicola marinus]|uniref:SusC/RagA family TonB-linked outer membrane protein n=1 Tax=Membranihabitans marinus TaxID=1227546 RepID=A0A953L7W8_9BACT|nr:SusC/RagA family TonB-linked outer membrane protein [Membranihabitans marinus]MBY5959157.1 SusC/RagA family TonB-linked outer membrane protein [Membranihabitans marinus]